MASCGKPPRSSAYKFKSQWLYDALQLIGGIILAVGYVPQILQIIQTQSTKDLNLSFCASVVIGIALMEIYAINLAKQKTGHAFLITNTLSLVLSGTILLLKIAYG